VGVIESFTVLHGRDGAEKALVTALMPDGRRALANTDDAETMAAMEATEHVGLDVRVHPDGRCEVLA
jgi:acetyl-CoA C-acetyltransferase